MDLMVKFGIITGMEVIFNPWRCIKISEGDDEWNIKDII
jgi:hypothetical protein